MIPETPMKISTIYENVSASDRKKLFLDHILNDGSLD
jgi:hypothetical protein